MKERNRDIWCDLDKRTLRRLLPGTIEEEPQTWKEEKKYQHNSQQYKRNEENTMERKKSWRKEQPVVAERSSTGPSNDMLGYSVIEQNQATARSLSTAPLIELIQRTQSDKNRSNGYLAIAQR